MTLTRLLLFALFCCAFGFALSTLLALYPMRRR